MTEPHPPDPGDERVAAPPDAGHLGSYTTPDDVMTWPPPDGPVPPLSSDSVRREPRRTPITPILLALLIILLFGLSLTGICQA